jgi:hypothetical protein
VSRRGRTAVGSLLVGPLVGAAVCAALMLVGQGTAGFVIGLGVSAVIAAVAARRSGYGDEKTVGWTLGSILVAFLVMAAIWIVFIAVLLLTCDDCIS